jgi:hypothetical protein
MGISSCVEDFARFYGQNLSHDTAKLPEIWMVRLVICLYLNCELILYSYTVQVPYIGLSDLHQFRMIPETMSPQILFAYAQMARVVRCSDEVTLRKYQAIIVSDDGK